MLAALKYRYAELFLCKAMHGRRLIGGGLVNVVVAASPFLRQQILLQKSGLFRRLLHHGAERAILPRTHARRLVQTEERSFGGLE